MPFAVGDVVAGRYEVQAAIGQRPLGWVYRAREQELGVEVALWVIGPEMLADEPARQAFVQRVGRARAFSHPNLVRVFGVFPTGDEVVVALQWAPGQTLYDRVQQKPFTADEARPLLAQVAAAMTHAHQHGVVLGDVHAATVVLLGATVKVANVGFGPALPRKRFLDAVKTAPGYARLPPEIKSGMTADTRADVYSLAMLLVDMLTGGPDRTKVQGSPALQTVLARALADDPMVRHTSVDALHHELDAALSGQPPRVRRPTPPVGVPIAREPSGPSRTAAPDKPKKGEAIEDATAPVPRDAAPRDFSNEETRAMDPEELDLLKGDQVTRQIPQEELFPLRVASSDTQQFELEMMVDDDETATSEELQLEKKPPPEGDDLKTDQVVRLEPDAAKTTEHPRLPPPVNEDEIDTSRVSRADVDEIADKLGDGSETDPNATPLPPPAPPGQLTPPPPAPPGARPSPPPPTALADAKDVPTKVEVPESKVHISVELPVIEVQEPPPPKPPTVDEPLYGPEDEEAPTRASGPTVGTLHPAPPAPAPSGPTPPEDDQATREHKAPPPRRRRRNPFEPVAPEANGTPSVQAVGAVTLDGKRKKKGPKPTVLVPPIGTRRASTATVIVVALAAFIAAVGVALAISHWLQQQRLEQERREKQRLADELNARAEAMKHNALDAGTAPAMPVVTTPDPALTILPRQGACPLGAHLVSSGGHSFCIDLYEYPGGNTIPRTSVSFAEAQRICTARGERLCSESEWERACRGKGGASYPYGQAYEASRCNTKGPGGVVVAAGSFPMCKSAVGAYDMSGNVAEWVASGAQKGGSALSGAHESRCSTVVRNPSPEGSVFVGFRCCADPTKTK